MATIHISEADAARDFPGLMAKVSAGDEIVIESSSHPPAILRSEFPAPRTISESIEIARQHERETGESPVLDADFAEDVAEVIRNRKPWTPPAWD
jgi:hypothetical protein